MKSEIFKSSRKLVQARGEAECNIEHSRTMMKHKSFAGYDEIVMHFNTKMFVNWVKRITNKKKEPNKCGHEKRFSWQFLLLKCDVFDPPEDVKTFSRIIFLYFSIYSTAPSLTNTCMHYKSTHAKFVTINNSSPPKCMLSKLL